MRDPHFLFFVKSCLLFKLKKRESGLRQTDFRKRIQRSGAARK